MVRYRHNDAKSLDDRLSKLEDSEGALVITDGVIYATPTIDITGGVLQLLQSRGPAAAAPKPAGR